jgi:hypothetical protein
VPSLPAAPSSTPSDFRVLARRDRWRRRASAWKLGNWLAQQERRSREGGAGEVERVRQLEGPTVEDWRAVPFRRTAGCGRSVVSDDGQVELRSKAGVVYTAGLQTCASVWACPVCRSKIAAHRQAEVAAAGRVHARAGGSTGMLTLTVRHAQTDDLAELVAGIRKAWRRVQQSKAWRPARHLVDGTITALEVTRGDNGWHPHLHVLVMGSDPVGMDELAEVARRLWADSVVHMLGGEHRPNATNGVHWTGAKQGDDAEVIARYAAKLGAEVTRGDWKANDVLAQLLDGVEAGDVEAVARYLEYTAAMRGRNQQVWSRGFRGCLAELADGQGDDEATELLGAVVSDEQAAEDDRGGDHVAFVDRRTWHRACRTWGAAGCVAILEHYERVEPPPP